MAALDALVAWAREHLPAGFSAPEGELDTVPVSGDAGFRHYFRLNTVPSLVAVIAPPEHENNPAFVSKGNALKRGGVHVPTIHAVDFSRGYMLLEDLGDRLLLPLLTPGSVAALYSAAEQVLWRIQAIDPDPVVFSPYSEQLLRDEMSLFPQWFVARLLGIELDAAEQQMLTHTFAALTASALSQPRVVVHRDYHSRNLLLLADDIGVVDFQDAVVGPFSYDLVSLLKDCYIRWPAALVRDRALNFLREACGNGNAREAAVDDRQLLAWFDLMGLQRHLKVLGIFARLSLRDGKPRYLDDLPLVLRYTLEVTQHYKEFSQFHQWFGDRLMPAITAQPWYRPWQQAGETP